MRTPTKRPRTLRLRINTDAAEIAQVSGEILLTRRHPLSRRVEYAEAAAQFERARTGARHANRLPMQEQRKTTL